VRTLGKLTGKVAFVSGAARAQGRSNAVKLAEAGADIVAVDLCEDIGCNHYPLGTWGDLCETAVMLEKFGQRAVIVKADVREAAGVRRAMAVGVGELGRLDIVVANAGILPLGNTNIAAFQDTIDVNLVGVINVMGASLAHVGPGASLIAIGSVVAFLPNMVDDSADAGGPAYGLAKRTLAQYIHLLARELGPHGIRANVIHPTNCNTDMLNNTAMYQTFRPDLDKPTREDALVAFPALQALPVPYVEPEDISNAVLFLATDDSRYFTGQQLRADAGAYVKVVQDA
jgi:SDR family mycofactocin-dependent oxidoreductase